MKLFPGKILVLGLFLAAGCKKDKDKNSFQIKGFDIFDQLGVPVGHIGVPTR